MVADPGENGFLYREDSLISDLGNHVIMTRSRDEQIHSLQQRRAEIELKLQRLRADKLASERKADTRRKIIAGALALTHAKVDPSWGQTLLNLIDEYTTKAADRALFDLPPLPAEPDAKGGDPP